MDPLTFKSKPENSYTVAWLLVWIHNLQKCIDNITKGTEKNMTNIGVFLLYISYAFECGRKTYY